MRIPDSSSKKNPRAIYKFDLHWHGILLEDGMTNKELDFNLGEDIKRERKITNQILHKINQAYEQRLYAHFAYPNMYDYLTKRHGYSGSSAYRRIQAAKMLRSLPEISTQMESGELNLSLVAQAQSAITAHEKINQPMTSQEKTELVQSVQGKTYIEAERVLIQKFPETQVRKTTTTPVNENTTRLALNLSNETFKKIERAQELHSHSCSDLAQLVDKVFTEHLKRHDPLARTQCGTDKVSQRGSVPKVSQHGSVPKVSQRGGVPKVSQLGNAPKVSQRESATKISQAKQKEQVMQNAQGKCTYKDPITGKVCGSPKHFQLDHIIPRALGGSDDISNKRGLCRTHNLLMAEKKLGKKWANAWRAEKIE